MRGRGGPSSPAGGRAASLHTAGRPVPSRVEGRGQQGCTVQCGTALGTGDTALGAGAHTRWPSSGPLAGSDSASHTGPARHRGAGSHCRPVGYSPAQRGYSPAQRGYTVPQSSGLHWEPVLGSPFL